MDLRLRRGLNFQPFENISNIINNLLDNAVKYSPDDNKPILLRLDSKDELVFVSSQSPNKNKDPKTKEGSQQVQRIVDDLADIFINSVAENRGVSSVEVREKYGKGSVFVGQQATEIGLVDELTLFEELIVTIGEPMGKEDQQPSVPLTAEAVAKNHPEIAKHFVDLGRAEENKRILGLEELSSPGMEDMISGFKADMTVTPESAAIQIVKAQKAQGNSFLQSIKTSEEAVKGTDSLPSDDRNSQPINIEEDLKQAQALGVIL